MTPIKTIPSTVPGGRIIQGRAMSGSPNISDIAETAIDKQIKEKPTTQKTVALTKRVLTPAEIARLYEAGMSGKGWMTTAEIADAVHGTKEAVAHHLRRLFIATPSKVERKRELGVKGNKHHVKFLWRWCAK